MATDYEQSFRDRVAKETEGIGVTRPVSDLFANKFWAASDPASFGTTMRAGGGLKDFKKQNDAIESQIKDPKFAEMLDHQTKTNIHLAGAVADLYLDNPDSYRKRMTQLTDRINADPAYATELKERLEKGEAFKSISEMNVRINSSLAERAAKKEAPAAEGTQAAPVVVAATAVVTDPFRMHTAEESLAEYEKMKADDPAFAQKFKSVDDTIKAALKQHPGKIDMLAKKEEREKLEAELAKSPTAFKTAFAGPAGQGDILSGLQSLKDIPIIGGLIQGIMQMFNKTPDGGTGMAIGDLGQALMGAFANMFGGSQVGQVMAQRGQEQLNGKPVESPNAKLGANVLQGDGLSVADRAALGRSDMTVSVFSAGNQDPTGEFNGLKGMVANLLPGVSTAPAPVLAKAPERREPLPGALPEPAPTWGHTAGTA